MRKEGREERREVLYTKEWKLGKVIVRGECMYVCKVEGTQELEVKGKERGVFAVVGEGRREGVGKC